VNDVGLRVAQGQSVAITGPSGSGKSTLLHLLGGLDRPSGGSVWLGHEKIDHLSERALAQVRRRRAGFVFQAFHLLEEMTALENVELPALLDGGAAHAARSQARSLLERVGLADRYNFLPSQLSGGQKQRVAIARALVNTPLLIFADEPTGNLDTGAAVEVLRLFTDLHASGQTLVVVTHDERVACTMSRRVFMRDGAVKERDLVTDKTVELPTAPDAFASPER
jgi:putative ABC transport system ATP-binding protein